MRGRRPPVAGRRVAAARVKFEVKSGRLAAFHGGGGGGASARPGRSRSLKGRILINMRIFADFRSPPLVQSEPMQMSSAPGGSERARESIMGRERERERARFRMAGVELARARSPEVDLCEQREVMLILLPVCSALLCCLRGSPTDH